MAKPKTYNIQLSGNEKIGLVSSLSTMLAAGIPILEAVQSLLEETKANQKRVLQELEADLISGNRMYASFAKFPKVFNKVTINLIKASEEAGTLEVTLKDLKRNIQEEMEFTDKVRAAMFYPMMVMVVFVGVFGLMLTVVIPKISQVFSRLNVPLPLPTKIMIWTSDILLKYKIPVAIAFLLLTLLLVYLYKQHKSILFKFLFRLPLVSDLIRQIDLTRFSRSMYLLLSSGLPIPTALELAEDVIMKKEVRDVVQRGRQQVIGGNHFSVGLKEGKKRVVPGLVIKLIEVGEKTGSLDRSMLDISEHLDYEVSKSLKTLTALMEPLMLVIVGVAVGGMMVSIISPMYGLIGSVGVR